VPGAPFAIILKGVITEDIIQLRILVTEEGVRLFAFGAGLLSLEFSLLVQSILLLCRVGVGTAPQDLSLR
jgi:hypothetical protein